MMVPCQKPFGVRGGEGGGLAGLLTGMTYGDLLAAGHGRLP